MNNHRSTCDPERVELFLEQKLSDEEQSAFESHLSACGNCRQRLETAAASEDISFEICESLRDEQLPPVGRPSDDPDSTGEDVSSSQATILKLLAPTDDDRMLGRWGTYEVVGVVGTGGMGVVLKAFDAALNRYVAIKILAPHLGTSGAAIRRFSREGKAAAAVVHDNVMEIYHVAEATGLPYLVMPYVRGPSLQRRLDNEGPLAVVEILRVAMQAAAGLAAAHAQGLVHRDVKPANILLADGVERVKLTDFGLARAADDASLTKTGVIAGTPQYMSPEQARGEPVDPRSDLFSLGSVLYAMCTGRPPFRAETSYGVLRRITDEEPRPIREINPDIPDWLCDIVAKLMAKRPDDRFQTASEVAALLEQCLAHVQQPTVVPLPMGVSLPSVGARKPRPFAGWSGRKRILFAMIGLLLFGGPALGIIIHLKKDGKTTTVEVPDGSTAHIDAHGAVTVELPSSPGSASADGGKGAEGSLERAQRRFAKEQTPEARVSLVKEYEKLLEAHPGGLEGGKIMLSLAGLCQSSHDYKKEAAWLRKACAAIPEGSPDWFEARFRLFGAIYLDQPEEARRIMRTLIEKSPDLRWEVKGYYWLQVVAGTQGKYDEMESIAMKLQNLDLNSSRMPKEMFGVGEVYQTIQDSQRSLMYGWAEMHDVPKARREAKIRAFAEKAHFRAHIDNDMAGALEVMRGGTNVAEAAWGDWNDGWSVRLRPDKTGWMSGESPEFTLDLRRREAAAEDKGQKDLMLNLGIMLGNGGAVYPTAVHLVLSDSAGKTRKLELMGPPGIAGRVDDFVVPVAPGSTYSLRLRLADYWCAATKEFRIALAPGEYRLRAVLESKPQQHKNSGMRMDLMRIWNGTLESAPVEISIVQPLGAIPASGGEAMAGKAFKPVPAEAVAAFREWSTALTEKERQVEQAKEDSTLNETLSRRRQRFLALISGTVAEPLWERASRLQRDDAQNFANALAPRADRELHELQQKLAAMLEQPVGRELLHVTSWDATSTKTVLQRVDKALAPVLKQLNPAPQVEFPNGYPSSLQVSYHTRNYKIHPGGKGFIDKEVIDHVGPDDDGFVLHVSAQLRGTGNQAMTPQTIHEPYWLTDLDVTSIGKTDKQIYWALSYRGRTSVKALRDIRAALKGLQSAEEKASPSGPAKPAEEEFLFHGWNGARDRLVSGVFRARGNLSRVDDDGAHCEGPLEYFYAFDYRKGRLRFDHTIPVIDRYEGKSGKVTAKTFREVGKYYQTPERTAESSNRQPDVIYLRKPGTLAVDQAKPFDVRAIGLMNFADFEEFTKYESLRVERWPEGLTSLSAVGSGVWCMRYTADRGIKSALWLNRDTGYGPVRYELRWPDPHVPPIESSEATWTQVGDVWVPKSVKMEQKMGKVHCKLDLVFDWESVNQAVSDDLFEFRSMLPPCDPGDAPATVQVISFESGKGFLLERLDLNGFVLPLRNAALRAEKPKEPAPAGPVLTYEVDPASAPAGISASDTETLLKAVDRRLNSGAEKLARARKSDDGRIEIDLLRPGDAVRQRVERLLARPGTLEFRILANNRQNKAVIAQAKKDPSKTEVLDAVGKKVVWWVPVKAGEEKRFADDPGMVCRTRKQDRREVTEVLVVADPCNVTGRYLTKVKADADNMGNHEIEFTFNEAGGKLFAKLTGDHLPDSSIDFRYKLGVIVDGELYSAPSIMSTISGGGRITGDFTEAEASNLAESLNGGSLPVRIRPARKMVAARHLHEIALAMYSYNEANGHFPPAVLYGPDGKTPYSWRVALLSYLGQKPLYDWYDFNEPWDSRHNQKVLEKMPDAFCRPEEPAESKNASCFALVGPGTIFDGKKGTKLEEITDGTSCTILLVEAKRDIPWTKPEDIPYDPRKPMPALGGYFAGGFHVATADASVRFIPSTVSEKVLRALISKAGGESVDIEKETAPATNAASKGIPPNTAPAAKASE